ncbi:menaquinol-cytochrome c reductase cytochrome b/c subunit [Pullulanibacillus camelliae]|uniref:Menaquinol-cytochrome c reductase cytochrome b/c subunit n=1 Tax=Pullulanibacillus camelliae TaxID=1707096 RepID=A0A8J2VMK9_9BACL|nr:cytochrome c [Pullulanibacillus camelliae]GGE38883.1 menaquinol-cytochrome c reductase cytochrome b/c subunit [Pullulanibacillus camelliae]
MHRGKGMKFVGDSRVPAKQAKFIPPKDYSEYPGKTEAFLPNFLLKEWMVGAVFLVGFLILTISDPSPLEKEADPTSSGYIPLPDWYFLFLYQLLKYPYASGEYKVIGTVLIPAIAALALLLAPWLDRGFERRPIKRPIATLIMLLTFVAMVYLTWESTVSHNWEQAEQQGKIVQTVDFDKSDPGYKIFSQNCAKCHGDNLEGSSLAPALVGKGLDPATVKTMATKGGGQMPSGIFKGSDKDLDALAKFVSDVSKK